MKLPNNLRSLRKSRKLSQEKLGDEVGLSGAEISKLETGNRNFTLDVANRLAEFFGCGREDVLSNDAGDTDEDAVLVLWNKIPEDRRRDFLSIMRTLATWSQAPSHAGVTLDPIDWENEGLRADDDRGRARSAKQAIRPSNKL